MITVLGLVFGVILLVGVVVLVTKSGGRKGKSSEAVARTQHQTSNPRGDVRSGNGLD